MTKLHLGLGLLLGGLLAWGCSSTSSGGTGTFAQSTGPGVGLGTGGTPGLGAGGNGPGLASGGMTGPDGTVVFRAHATGCDANNNCAKCITLVSLGAPASKSYGTGNDSTTEFESWLTNTSNAAVTFVNAKVALTADFLNQYDVVLLQDLRAWGTFTPDEIATFQAWIEGGGGVIALSGYFSDGSAEIVPTNQLLAGTGLSLMPTEVPGQTCDVSSSTLCPNSKASASAKCYCWANSLPITQFTPGTPFAANVAAVGSFRGRQVNPGDPANVVANYLGSPVAAYKPVGTGKVFVFGDEWITYTSQWLSGGQPTTDPYNPCWDEVAATSCLAGHVFQVKQFWYNSIVNVSPPSQCNFKIVDEGVILL